MVYHCSHRPHTAINQTCPQVTCGYVLPLWHYWNKRGGPKMIPNRTMVMENPIHMDGLGVSPVLQLVNVNNFRIYTPCFDLKLHLFVTQLQLQLHCRLCS